MNDLAGLQEKLDAFDKLLQALMPFVSPPARERLKQLQQMLQPFTQLKEMMEMLEVMNAMQEMGSAFGAGNSPKDGWGTETTTDSGSVFGVETSPEDDPET